MEAAQKQLWEIHGNRLSKEEYFLCAETIVGKEDSNCFSIWFCSLLLSSGLKGNIKFLTHDKALKYWINQF